MIAPVGAQTFTHAMQICTEIYHTLKSIIIERSGKAATGLGDEGGFAPPLKSADEALHLLELATLKAGYSVYRNQSGQQHGDVAFGIDPASSEFFDKKRKLYDLGFKFDPHDKAKSDFCLSSSELGEVYESICKKYSVILLEDPFAEDDFDSWKNFTRKHSCGLEIVGDDLLATNPKRIRIGIEQALCNSLLLKINQIGTITEAIESAQLARNNGWRVFVSHRSGETVDDFIADCELIPSVEQILRPSKTDVILTESLSLLLNLISRMFSGSRAKDRSFEMWSAGAWREIGKIQPAPCHRIYFAIASREDQVQLCRI